MGCSHTGRPPQLTRSCHTAAVPRPLTFPKPASWGFADDPPRCWKPSAGHQGPGLRRQSFSQAMPSLPSLPRLEETEDGVVSKFPSEGRTVGAERRVTRLDPLLCGGETWAAGNAVFRTAEENTVLSCFEEQFLQVSIREMVENCEHNYLAPRFRRIIPNHQPLLEAGCGAGQWVAWAVETGSGSIILTVNPPSIPCATTAIRANSPSRQIHIRFSFTRM